MKAIFLIFNLCLAVAVLGCKKHRPHYSNSYYYSRYRALPEQFGPNLNFIVSVQDKKGSHLCIGALIRKIWVLTSATCLTTDQLQIEHINGTIPVKSIHKSSSLNLALLKLEEAVKSKQIRIAKIKFNKQAPVGNVTALSIHDIATKQKGGKVTRIGFIDDLNIEPQEHCVKKFESISKNKNLLCVTGKNLRCHQPTNRILLEHKTQAIIAFSTKQENCDSKKKTYKGVFDYIEAYENWISTIVGKDN